MKSPTVTLLLWFSIIGATAWSQTPASVREEFQVNTYTTGDQTDASVDADASGAFVVVWKSNGSSGTDTDALSIQGQRYDAAGLPVGGEFQVNSYTTGRQTYAVVAMESDGDFVVVWSSAGSSGADTNAYSIQGKRFDSTGSVVGDEFEVNTYTTGNQLFPSLAAGSDGNFIVVWSSNGSDGSDTSNYSIQGQRFNAAGTAVGDQFQVNTYTTDRQILPSVALDPDGDFVVVWESIGSGGSDNDSYSIQARRYGVDGTAVGAQFQVNSYTVGDQRAASLAVDADGDVVVIWDSTRFTGEDISLKSVQGQLYDSAGSAVGGEFQINTYTTSHQRFPSVAMDPDGDFVVVWESMGSSGSDTNFSSVQGQRFDPTATPVGGEFQVNTYTTSFQIFPSVAVRVDGDFVVAWESGGSSGTDNPDFSIQGQRYATPIFADGFESGDVSAWSSSLP